METRSESMIFTNPGSVTAPRQTEHFDVVIVGAGISGVGGAYHLTKQCPGMSFVVLEAQESFGGTWRTHRYPGIRSDSDLGSHSRYRQEIVSASWSSDTNLWTLEATRTDTGEPVRIAANFLWMGQGYYRHAQGYTPDWDGMETFKGQI